MRDTCGIENRARTRKRAGFMDKNTCVYIQRLSTPDINQDEEAVLLKKKADLKL